MTVKEHITKKISRSLDGSLFFNNSFPNYDDVYVRQILSELCSQNIVFSESATTCGKFTICSL